MTDEQGLRTSVSSRGRLRPLYLLFGNDPFLVKSYTARIAKCAVPANAELNLFDLNENASLQSIYDRLFQFSFTGETVCVTVSNFNFEAAKKEVFDELLKLVAEAPEQNVLVLYYDVLEVDPKKSDRFKRLAKAVEANNGMVCQLNHKSEGELVKTLVEGAAKRLRRLDASTARYMISVCSGDLNILQNELDKLAAFSGEDEAITREMIDTVCVKTLEASVYDLSQFILAGKAQQAYYLLDNLLASGSSPAELHFLIASAYIDIFRAKATIDAGLKADSVASQFGYGPKREFLLRKAEYPAKKLSNQQISAILRELVDSDALIKGGIKGMGNSKTALEALIAKIIKIAAGGAK